VIREIPVRLYRIPSTPYVWVLTRVRGVIHDGNELMGNKGSGQTYVGFYTAVVIGILLYIVQAMRREKTMLAKR